MKKYDMHIYVTEDPLNRLLDVSGVVRQRAKLDTGLPVPDGNPELWERSTSEAKVFVPKRETPVCTVCSTYFL